MFVGAGEGFLPPSVASSWARAGTGSFEEAAASIHPDWAGFPVASEAAGLSPGNSSSLRTGDISHLRMYSEKENPKLAA